MSLKFNIAQLRHAYTHLKAGRVHLQAEFADGLISPIIQFLEELDRNTPPKPEWVVDEGTFPQPTKEGWYRVMHSGDSETIDGHWVVYDYPDYEAWAYWVPADENEYEDFEGGYKGHWQCEHDEDGDFIFAYYGPIEKHETFAEYEKRKKKEK